MIQQIGVSPSHLFVLILIFFATSAVSVITGSTSLITVPAMLQLHIEPKTAVATNMFALTFLSLGASLPFSKGAAIDRRRAPLLAGLTSLGSLGGAILLLYIPTHTLSAIVPLAMIGVAIFSAFWKRNRGLENGLPRSRRHDLLGYGLTFLLGVYGGFFSGGYVTILTAVFTAAFGFTFREAIAMTKFMNVCSSAIATAVFISKGLVDYRLGAILGLVMFLGAGLGARTVLRLSEVWLSRLFFTAVWVLGFKALLFDLWQGHTSESGEAPVTR